MFVFLHSHSDFVFVLGLNFGQEDKLHVSLTRFVTSMKDGFRLWRKEYILLAGSGARCFHESDLCYNRDEVVTKNTIQERRLSSCV